MGNPLSDVSQGFWDILNWIDSLMLDIGAGAFGYQPLAPQFEYLQKVDTDEIRRVASTVWQEGSGLVPQRFEEAQDLITRAERQLESWEGEAKAAYLKAVQDPREALVQVAAPAQALSQALNDLADSYDTSIIDLIDETIKGTEKMWAEMPEGEPEDGAEAIIWLIMYIIAILVSIVVYFQEFAEAAETNIANVKATIDECRALAASTRR